MSNFTIDDPLGIGDFLNNVLYPMFSNIFFSGRRDWITDPITEAMIDAIEAPTASDAAAIILRVLDVDPNLLLESLILTGRYPTVENEAPVPPNEEATDDINEYIDLDLNDLATQADANLAQILDVIIQGAIDQTSIFERVAADIVGDIITGQSSTESIINDVLGGISTKIDESSGILGDIFDIVTGQIDLEITNRIVIPSDVFGVIINGIGDILDGEREFVDGILATITDAFTGIFTDVIEREQPELIAIEQAIRDQTTEERLDNIGLLDEVRLINDGTIEGTGASILDGVVAAAQVMARDGEPLDWGELYRGFDPQVQDDNCRPTTSADDTPNLYSIGELSDAAIKELIKWFADPRKLSNPLDSALESIWYTLGKAQGGLAISGAMAARELYEFARCVPYEIFEPGDAVVAYQRNLISRNQLKTDLNMRGYNDARADILTEIGYQVPDISSLYSMNLRGLAPGENLTDRFQDLGYNPADAQALADLKFYIPPAQDLITMAVREVFNPEIVAKFGQNEDFPEEFAEYAEQQGISRFWAEKYWQAHWVLPSVQMGFEMLHRRVIDEATLRQLLAAQDVMPGWRDALIAISYKPYTRVDIRRMHDVGVLNEAEVFEAYQDIGYDQEKARTLTDFTLELNSDDPDDVEPLEGLTRSSIIAAYKDGIIDRPTADSLLVEEGIGEDARLIYLTDAELDIDRTMRKEVIDTVLVEYENGAANLNEAVAELNTLALTPLEREKAELKLRRITAKKTKLPSKADLSKFYKLDIIGKGTFKDQLERLGYPDRWIDDYIELVKEGKLPDDEPTL